MNESNSWLTQDRMNVSDILEQTRAMATKYFDTQDTLAPGRFISDLALAPLADKGVGAMETLRLFEDNFADQITNSAGSRYFGFVTGGSTPASVAGDWLVSTYDQNACGSNDSIAPQVERQTIHYLKELFGIDANYFGSFVTGATISNFVGLAIGRQWIGEQQGIDISEDGISALRQGIKVISATPHASILKSLSMAGLGRKALVKMETLPGREAIDIARLEQYLSMHPEPAIVVANAGTVNTVDFDDLEAIGKLKERYRFWLHIDAAFGGFAACSEKFKHLMQGVNYADSITIDAHKWLNIPYDAAMQFTRHKNIQLKVFQNSAAYLGDPSQSPDYFHYTPENSRRWRALPAWFSLVAYGRDGYREIVERNCNAADYFGKLIDTSDAFRLLAPVRMNVVCFTIAGDTVTTGVIRDFLNAVRDDGAVFFTPTIYNGVPGIRAALSNWQTEIKDIDIAFEAITRLAPRAVGANWNAEK